MSKLKLMMGASALISAALAGAANAQVTMYGGGSTLDAPYIRQAADCYGNPEPLLYKTGSNTAPTSQTLPLFDYVNAKSSKDFNCATKHVNTSATIWYNGTGSGTGIKALYTGDPTQFGPYDSTGTQFWPEVHYAASDAALLGADVSAYNNGGTEQGLTFVAPGVTPGAGQYKNPAQYYGPMIQFPILIAPVAIAYAPIYEKVANSSGVVTAEYKFNIAKPRSDGSGGLQLSQAAYCAIFNGTITNWNSSVLKTLNQNKSLEDPTDPTPAASWSVPLQIVGRSDSSGTTYIFTRALTTQCGTTGNNYTGASTTLPAALQGPTWNKTTPNTPVAGETLGKFTLASGSDGVSKYIDFSDNTSDPNYPTGTQPSAGQTLIRGRVGYLGVDYALPYVTNTGENVYGLNTANLQNAAGKYIVPTPAGAAAAFTGINAPQTSSAGAFTPTVTTYGLRANPQDWVLGYDTVSPLAQPAGATSYPLTGTSQGLFYTCYKSPSVVTALTSNKTPNGFLYWYTTSLVTTDAKAGILAKAGYDVMPKGWLKAIQSAFLQGSDGLGLKITTAGSAGVCASVSGAG